MKKDPVSVVDYDRLTLRRVELSYAVCAVYCDGDRIVEIAPILYRLARSVGMSWARTWAALQRRGGRVSTLYIPPSVSP